MLDAIVGMLLMSVLIIAPNALFGLLLAMVVLPVYLLQRGGKKKARPLAERAEPAAAEEAVGNRVDNAEANRRYGPWAPTRTRLLELRERLVVTPLGGEREAQFKALLDRALSEDFFTRFGDSFVVLMKVNVFHVVRPRKEAPQAVWNAVIKRQADFLICDRWTLEPVLAILVWMGEGEPPGCAGGSDEEVSAGVRRALSEREWEQWMAQGLLLAVGVPAMLLSGERIDKYLAQPELLLAGLEPALTAHRVDVAMRERAAA